MSPLDAIEMATAMPPETLYVALVCCLVPLFLTRFFVVADSSSLHSGRQARKAGQLKVGYDADIIAISKSPLENIGILTNLDNVTHVWKGGVLYKKP